MPKSKLFDCRVKIHARTSKALYVSETDDEKKAVWLPLSQIEYEEKDGYADITMPEWLAIDKGFV